MIKGNLLNALIDFGIKLKKTEKTWNILDIM